MTASPVCCRCEKAILSEDAVVYIGVEHLLLHLTCYEPLRESTEPLSVQQSTLAANAPDRAA
jgi:hypothetical protein